MCRYRQSFDCRRTLREDRALDLPRRFELAADCRHAALGLENAVNNHVTEAGNKNEHGERFGVDMTEQTTPNILHHGNSREDRRAAEHDPAISSPPSAPRL